MNHVSNEVKTTATKWRLHTFFLQSNKMSTHVNSCKYLIVVLVIFHIGCDKEINPCSVARDGENYTLSDSAKNYVNNYRNANRIIFKSSTGNEVSFDVMERDTIAPYSLPVSCEVDELQGQLLNGTSELLSYSLTNNSILPLPLVVSALEFPETPSREAQEVLVISLGEYLSESFSQGDFLLEFNFNANDSLINYLDSIQLAGKTFYSVYEQNFSDYTPNLEVKYSLNEGIIYIKNPQNSSEFIYERKE